MHGKTMKALAAAALAALLAGPVLAADEVDGEVRRIDRAQSKVTLKHGEIRSLEMPPMTMVFVVRDASQLDGLAVGDKVRFTVERVGGQTVVTQMTKAAK